MSNRGMRSDDREQMRSAPTNSVEGETLQRERSEESSSCSLQLPSNCLCEEHFVTSEATRAAI